MNSLDPDLPSGGILLTKLLLLPSAAAAADGDAVIASDDDDVDATVTVAAAAAAPVSVDTASVAGTPPKEPTLSRLLTFEAREKEGEVLASVVATTTGPPTVWATRELRLELEKCMPEVDRVVGNTGRKKKRRKYGKFLARFVLIGFHGNEEVLPG